MSAALQSLMRDMPAARPDAPALVGLPAFLVIGGTAASFYVILTTGLIWLDTGIADWVINTICYAGFILPVYLVQRRFSFRSEVPHWHALPRYVAVQGMALLLAATFSYIVHGVFAFPAVLSSMLVIGLTSGVNFVVLRRWAFARERFLVVVPA